jgi:hypothetical protein
MAEKPELLKTTIAFAPISVLPAQHQMLWLQENTC